MEETVEAAIKTAVADRKRRAPEWEKDSKDWTCYAGRQGAPEAPRMTYACKDGKVIWAQTHRGRVQASSVSTVPVDKKVKLADEREIRFTPFISPKPGSSSVSPPSHSPPFDLPPPNSS